MKLWGRLPGNAVASFSANSILKLANPIQQCRAFRNHCSISEFKTWVPRSERMVPCIKCSKARDYSSSFPVRYIPKQTLDSEKSKAGPATEQSDCTKNHSNRYSDVERVGFSHSAYIPDNTHTYAVETMSQNPDIESMNFGVGLGFGEDSVGEKPFEDDDVLGLRVGEGVGEDFDGDVPFEDDDVLEEPEEVMQKVGIYKEHEHGDSGGIQGSRIKQDVENKAVEILAKRAFTAVELRKKLLGKHFPLVIVDDVIMDFQKRGLINDSLYAETYSRSRWSTSTWGPRRIKKVLLAKGVNYEDVDRAVKLVLNDSKCSEDKESEFGMSPCAMDHLFAQASKQWMRSGNVSSETRKSRIIRWLQYRGFGWNVISFVLKKLESGHSPCRSGAT